MIKILIVFVLAIASGVGVMLTPTSPAHAQTVATDVCMARWEWFTEEDYGSYWVAPGDAIGTLDLRSLSQMGTEGPVALGWGLFSYETAGPVGAQCLKTQLGSRATLDTPMTAAQANTWGVIAGLGATDIRARDMRNLIVELFIDEGDPTGSTRWKPVQLTRRGLGIKFGGFGEIYGERFSETSQAMTNTLDIRWADYRRHKANGVETDTLRRWTGLDAIKLFGRSPTSADLDRLIPTEYRSDGSLPPDTSLGDSFNRSDNTDLNDVDTGKTKDGGSGTWQWVEDSGDLEVASNEIIKNGSGKGYARADEDLSSADHYSEIDITSNPDSDGRTGTTVRADDTGAITFYRGVLRGTNDNVQVHRVVTGTETQLGSNQSVTVSIPDTLRMDVSGSTVELLYNGSTIISETDTAITGNLQVGVAFGNNNDEAATMDDWFADDGVSAAGRRRVNIS